MKTLKELGISTSPWVMSVRVDADLGMDVLDADGKHVCSCRKDGCGFANARLLAAAPALYEALREAATERCRMCVNEGDYCSPEDDYCYVQRWRKTLELCSYEGCRKALEEEGRL